MNVQSLASSSFCHTCGKHAASDVKLKKCMRCELVLYCGRECQKRDWPAHKQECRSEQYERPEYFNPTLAQWGFATNTAFGKTFQAWTDVHLWSIAAMVKAGILLQGGRSAVKDPPSIATFMLRRIPSLGHPASGFHVETVSILTIEYFHRLGLEDATEGNWRRAQPIREVQEKRYANDPDYVGSFPVSFFVDHITTTIAYYPLIRDMDTASSAVGRVGRTDREETPEELLRLCSCMVDSGLPLWALDISQPNTVFPGRFKQNSKGSWTWSPIFTDWREYRHADLIDVNADSGRVTKRKAKGNPQKLITLFRVL